MTLVGFLARMRTYVDLEIFRTREGFLAQMATMWLLLGVRAHMDEHLVACIEAALAALAATPAAIVESIQKRSDRMTQCDVLGECFQRLEYSAGAREMGRT